jgi:hypothetical protein
MHQYQDYAIEIPVSKWTGKDLKHQYQDYVIEISIFTENLREMLYKRQYKGLRRH